MKIGLGYNWLLVIICLVPYLALSQDDGILSREVTLQFNENTLLGHVDNLLVQENISITFNSSRVDLQELIILPKGPLLLGQLVELLFYKNKLKLTAKDNRVLIRFLDGVESPYIRVRGYIKDKLTGEALVGATIFEFNSFASTFSSESGFFSLSIPRDSSRIRYSYLGYQSEFETSFSDTEVNVFLEFDNELAQVVIKESISDNFTRSSGGKRIDIKKTEGFQSLSGENDLLQTIKVEAGVQSGNEGQSGILVRGGSHDQNLVLFEGVPLYEVSHAAGFSNMFIEESIRDVNFIKNGFPARYGGRLSSVINVKLKDGNQSGMHGSVNAALPSIKAHLEGPILGGKTTFNLSGRISYLNSYLDNVIGDLVNYDIGIAYDDVVAKITHNFSPARKLSFSMYSGGDDLGLYREVLDSNESGDSFKTESDINLKWGSTVWNFNFSNIINDKLQLSVNVGGINYQYSSRGSYGFESVFNKLSSEAELEVVTYSEIVDYLSNLNFDYYLSDKHVVKFGAGWIYHNYVPAVRSGQFIQSGIISIVQDEEQRIGADELSAYIEDTYDPHEDWQFYAGLHFAGYNVGVTRYRNAQPRLSAIYKPGTKDRIKLSYTKMNQYVHLLVNPGIGLPSNLWVPSTEDILPESSDQVSIDYDRKLTETINFSISGYYKFMQNLIEYRTAVDLIYLGGTNQSLLPLQEDNDWQKRVELGSSTSQGLELQLDKTAGRFQGWVAYTLSKTNRQFDSIDEGQPFPYKYDRRHDVNVGAKYVINDNCSVSTNWVYGSGNSFSLSIEEFRSPFGVLRTSGLRNNYQQEPFHHLDFQFNYSKKFAGSQRLHFQVGIYNAYNRKNPYFIYIYDSPTLGRAEARKISLFPVLPNINVGYEF